MTSATLTAAQIAEMLQISRDHFYKIQPDMEARGFPPRLPGISGRWPRKAVEAWIETSGGMMEARELETSRPDQIPPQSFTTFPGSR